MDEPGVLSVIKSNSTVSELKKYLKSLNMGNVGPITIIYSKGRATSNSVLVVERKMYNYLLDLINGDVSPIKPWSVSKITMIEPYLIGDSHFPTTDQNKNIFLRFDYGQRGVPMDGINLSSQVRLLLNKLVHFKIMSSSDTIDVDIPRNILRPVEFGFIKFDPNIDADIPIYIRSILNGHVLKEGIKICAYWCSKNLTNMY
jgi:hypothetical protein